MKGKDIWALWIFVLSVIFYAGMGLFFVAFTQLPLHSQYIHDLYLGFDNTYQNTSAVRHPLLKVFSVFLHLWLPALGYEAFFIVLFCAILLAIQHLFLFKYFTDIIGLCRKKVLLVLWVYAGFSVNFILSFTFESYVFSLALMSIFLYANAYYQGKGERLPSSLFYALGAMIGGITITNGIKVFLIRYYQNPKKLLVNVLMMMGLLGIVVWLFFDRISKSILHFTQFLGSGEHYFSDVFYLFLGGSVVFPDLAIEPFHYENREVIQIIVAQYPSLFSIKTLIIANVLGIMIFSVVRHWRDRNIQAVLLLFSVDIIIHCILGLGLSEAQIFGGNYIFIYPILMAYTLKNHQFYRVMMGNLILLGILIYYSNILDLKFIWDFGKAFYSQ